MSTSVVIVVCIHYRYNWVEPEIGRQINDILYTKIKLRFFTCSSGLDKVNKICKLLTDIKQIKFCTLEWNSKCAFAKSSK